ncbi:hypothetical protein, partial [Rhodobacter calidifons]
MPRRLSLAVLLLCAAPLLSACQLTGAKGPASATDADVTPNAVIGDPIDVKPLDSPPAAAAKARPGAADAGAGRETPVPAAASS